MTQLAAQSTATDVAQPTAESAPPSSTPPSSVLGRISRYGWLLPTLVALANAVAVIIVSPGVNDIWAALARESAVGHGVGLTYWFSWFGGAATPASYSVLAPYVSHLIGVRGLGAVAAVAITPLTWLALRNYNKVVPAVWVATFAVGENFWSGRVPFLFGTALAVVAMVALGRRRVVLTVVFSLLAGLASPVPAAFLAIALVGVYLVRPSYRRICLITFAALAASLLLVTVAFGAPGSQHFTLAEALSCALPIVAYLLTKPPPALKATLWIALLGCPLIYLIPNGLGSNYQRLAWYCLPAVVLACTRRRVAVSAFALIPALVFGMMQTVTDISQSSSQSSSTSTFVSLSNELDRIGAPLLDHRLEVVDDGTHTAAYALLDHAMLARGWETQEDTDLNHVLYEPTLDATTYAIWLQNNAVGYVAISSKHRGTSVEYALVTKKRPSYLSEVWHDPRWTLYRVAHANPIVGLPAHVTRFSQSDLTIRVPCACTLSVRVHWSSYLTASTRPASAKTAPVSAKLVDDGFGWTRITTTQPGTYVLTGSLTHGLFREP